MFSPLAALAVFVASVSAITITSPGTSKSWTNDGAQTITWTSVNTDASNFTILLTNTNTTLIPTQDNNQVLKALQVTSDGTTTVNPPASGWPSPGKNYRVNFVKSTEETSTIYVQSDPFDIVAATVAQSSSASNAVSYPPATSGTTPTTPAAGASAGAGSATDAADASGSASDSGSAPAATGTNAALPTTSLHTGFFGALVLLGALLA